MDQQAAESVLTTTGFESAQQAFLERRREVWPARAWYPSSVGHPCDRFLVWRATRSETQALHDYVLQSIFDQGKELQPIIQRRLELLGFTVQGEGDRPKQYKARGALISGRPDGKLIAYKGQPYRPAPVAEFKSMSAYQFDRTETVEDLRKASSPWTRSYYAQGQLYAYLEDVPSGVFVLMNKTTGMLRLLPFELDYGFVESLLQRVERLQPMVEQGVDPDPIPYDDAVCGRCGFKGQCWPPRDFGPGLAVLEDEALLEDLETRERLKAAKEDYDELDKAIKARLKRDGVRSAIAGRFSIEAADREVKSYTVAARTDTVFTIRRQG
jgi:hypothetical protein